MSYGPAPPSPYQAHDHVESNAYKPKHAQVPVSGNKGQFDYSDGPFEHAYRPRTFKELTFSFSAVVKEWRHGSKTRVLKYMLGYFFVGFIIGTIIRAVIWAIRRNLRHR